MKPTIYIETTIPSYYCDDRRELASDISRTRTWWEHERSDYECFTSSVVLDELAAGQYASQRACLTLVDAVPVLRVTDEVLEIARLYQDRRLMPQHPLADALHLAIASFYRVDYLLTWNCRHLANANKARHLELINQTLRLGVPLLVTPHQLQPWEEIDDE